MRAGVSGREQAQTESFVMADACEEPVTVSPASAAERAEVLPRLAQLRVEVFRAWPYLYAGDAEYEAGYLETYARSPLAGIILARQSRRIVGASTCLPLVDETASLKTSFIDRGWDPADFFYFGESVLLPELRGRGIGVSFFEEREAHARRVSSCRIACFCSVVRPNDHPARPEGAVPLDAFWTRRGYTRRPDVTCEMSWTDVGDTGETSKTLVVWMKSLDGGPLP